MKKERKRKEQRRKKKKQETEKRKNGKLTKRFHGGQFAFYQLARTSSSLEV